MVWSQRWDLGDFVGYRLGWPRKISNFQFCQKFNFFKIQFLFQILNISAVCTCTFHKHADYLWQICNFKFINFFNFSPIVSSTSTHLFVFLFIFFEKKFQKFPPKKFTYNGQLCPVFWYVCDADVRREDPTNNSYDEKSAIKWGSHIKWYVIRVSHANLTTNITQTLSAMCPRYNFISLLFLLLHRPQRESHSTRQMRMYELQSTHKIFIH